MNDLPQELGDLISKVLPREIEDFVLIVSVENESDKTYVISSLETTALVLGVLIKEIKAIVTDVTIEHRNHKVSSSH